MSYQPDICLYGANSYDMQLASYAISTKYPAALITPVTIPKKYIYLCSDKHVILINKLFNKNEICEILAISKSTFLIGNNKNDIELSRELGMYEFFSNSDFKFFDRKQIQGGFSYIDTTKSCSYLTWDFFHGAIPEAVKCHDVLNPKYSNILPKDFRENIPNLNNISGTS